MGPFEAALSLSIMEDYPFDAAENARRLGEILTIRGKFEEAKRRLEQAVDFADKGAERERTDPERPIKIQDYFDQHCKVCESEQGPRTDRWRAKQEGSVALPGDRRLPRRVINPDEPTDTRVLGGMFLHQCGRWDEAESWFKDAEDKCRERKVNPEFLADIWDFWYRDYLGDLGRHPEVESRAKRSLALQEKGDCTLLHIACDNLSLGRSALCQAVDEEDAAGYEEAEKFLQAAVQHFDRAAQVPHQVYAWLIQADLFMIQGRLEEAGKILNRCESTVRDHDMGLRKADLHLAFGYWQLFKGEKARAIDDFAEAERLINQIGYKRRERLLNDLRELSLKRPVDQRELKRCTLATYCVSRRKPRGNVGASVSC
jgi:tetratricopeptide (TPR) repeat protein